MCGYRTPCMSVQVPSQKHAPPPASASAPAVAAQKPALTADLPASMQLSCALAAGLAAEAHQCTEAAEDLGTCEPAMSVQACSKQDATTQNQQRSGLRHFQEFLLQNLLPT